MDVTTLFNTEETALQGPIHDQSTSWQDPYQLGQFPNLIDDGMLQMPDLVAPAATEVTATATGSTGKPFNCTVTGCNSKGFMRRYELERHMRKHNRTEVFTCPFGSCPFSRQTKAFYRRDKLQSHLRKDQRRAKLEAPFDERLGAATTLLYTDETIRYEIR
ncbi:putative transcription factor c2h2 [Diplodia seriata]|uniref:Putative transcription factor c2h2 n=1 Tax=Diplodia seriata TaxID=420778 RepID=A0A0G2EQN7_9PEZI|nr:putative transcription factor c2h2 [Diplodia seriata]